MCLKIRWNYFYKFKLIFQLKLRTEIEFFCFKKFPINYNQIKNFINKVISTKIYRKVPDDKISHLILLNAWSPNDRSIRKERKLTLMKWIQIRFNIPNDHEDKKISKIM